MRTNALVGVTLALAVAGCVGSRHATTAPRNVSLVPLGSCETRVLSLRGADLVVNANADSTLASVRVVNATNHLARDQALATVYHTFGAVHLDTDVVARESKWGLATWTDRCGRPITFTSPPRTPPIR
jgi:hypothetical protein